MIWKSAIVKSANGRVLYEGYHPDNGTGYPDVKLHTTRCVDGSQAWTITYNNGVTDRRETLKDAREAAFDEVYMLYPEYLTVDEKTRVEKARKKAYREPSYTTSEARRMLGVD